MVVTKNRLRGIIWGKGLIWGSYSLYSYHLLAKRHNEGRLYTRCRGRRNPFLKKALLLKLSRLNLGARIRPSDSFSLGSIPGRPTRWRDTFRFEPLSVSLLSWKLFAWSFWQNHFPRMWKVHFQLTCVAKKLLYLSSLLFSPPPGAIPYKDYKGMCRPVGYGFWGSRSIISVSFLPLLAPCSRCDP